MVALRCLPFVLLAALAPAVQAQDATPPGGGASASRPSGSSVPSLPSVPSAGDMGSAGPAAADRGGTSPGTRTGSTSAPRGPSAQLLGAGTFGAPGTGFENVLNSGTPPPWDRKAGVRKVCPPELENRNNVCVAPVGSILTP